MIVSKMFDIADTMRVVDALISGGWVFKVASCVNRRSNTLNERVRITYPEVAQDLVDAYLAGQISFMAFRGWTRTGPCTDCVGSEINISGGGVEVCPCSSNT